MTRKKLALIIGTDVATNGFESGAALRLISIKSLVKASGFNVSVASRASAKDYLKSEWDLVVLVSFSTCSLLRLARKRSKLLWFDSTDSWTITRISLFLAGDFRQVFALLRDSYFILTSPKIDLITFINERDSIKESRWWKKRSVPFILPIEGLNREINLDSPARLVFSGDGKYISNRKALKFLQKTLEFLPSDFRIHLIGRHLKSPSTRFVAHGYLLQQEMYSINDVHLAPIRYGAGLKLKVAIPLWNGLRVISTPEGSSGFKKSSRLNIASTPRQFAETILGTLKEDNPSVSIKPGNQIYLRNDIYEVSLWLNAIE
jgi:hypothetical protein